MLVYFINFCRYFRYANSTLIRHLLYSEIFTAVNFFNCLPINYKITMRSSISKKSAASFWVNVVLMKLAICKSQSVINVQCLKKPDRYDYITSPVHNIY